MNVLYYTSGQGLVDGEIRRQVLRIPEVLKSVREMQETVKDWDLMASLLVEERFDRLPQERQMILVRAIQQGLFERFCRARVPYTEILQRTLGQGPSMIVRELRWMLRSDEPMTIYVIGPGLDEVPMLLKNPRAEFIEVIDNDPELQWFWGELHKVANA